MYRWIWRHLPGSTAIKATLAVLIVAAVVALLFLIVFPWLSPRLPFTNTTIDASSVGPLVRLTL